MLFQPLFTKRDNLKCRNGHTLCSNCKTMHDCCPTCRLELGDIRCLALERWLSHLSFHASILHWVFRESFHTTPNISMNLNAFSDHINCPYAGSECFVTGAIPFLVSHLGDDHKVDMHTGCTFSHKYVKSKPHEVENATWMLTVASPV